MADSPLVSIIIPTFNRAHLIAETLDSVLAQTYTNWECIIVDDGSTDNTSLVVNSYVAKEPRFKFYHRPPQHLPGGNGARNFGFKMSKGDFIVFFDSDDIMSSENLRLNMYNLLASEAQCSVSNISIFRGEINDVYFKIFNNSTSDNILEDYLIGKINLGTPSMFWEKEAISDKLFNEHLFRAQELDFHFRILKNRNLKFAFINDFLVSVRRHEASLTTNYIHNDFKSIQSELFVRREIIKYANEFLKNEFSRKKVFQLYAITFIKLYRNFNIIKIFIELLKLISIYKIKPKFFYWNLKTVVLIILFKLTRRDYVLKKHLFAKSVLWN